MKNYKTISRLLLGGLAALSVMAAQAAPTYASATVSGALAPGVYGRIDIGNAPPPPLVYAQPVIIQRAPVYVQQPPMYLHVPPGHAKKWSRHCARYNACNRPVYFVKVRGDDDYERRRGMHPQPVYMHKNDWKEARRYEKEREKQEKRYWKQHEKRHDRRHGHDD